MIPERTKEAIDRYVKHGVHPGGFGIAVLENNLMEAFGRADEEHCRSMLHIVQYVYNAIPSACWGSPDRVNRWLGHRGMEGLLDREHKEVAQDDEDGLDEAVNGRG